MRPRGEVAQEETEQERKGRGCHQKKRGAPSCERKLLRGAGKAQGDPMKGKVTRGSKGGSQEGLGSPTSELTKKIKRGVKVSNGGEPYQR